MEVVTPTPMHEKLGMEEDDLKKRDDEKRMNSILSPQLATTIGELEGNLGQYSLA
ncbi:uncharacterized protein G2W53_000887 [Senna tora]|uniref:Uncharacterized protein n=1 Tax=Senna tora TaxID=362788 RepID=A0A834XGR5_9FABA|nr:uncharacterized protein G2W53_000887 [Senna tora]